VARQTTGPAALALAALVARRFYLDQRSKVEIAEELGHSRFKIARLLEMARDSGLVRIEIGQPGLIDVDLAAQMLDRFGLTQAVVVDTEDEHAESLRRHLGQVAAELIAEIIEPDDVFGVAWSRSVGAMAKALPRVSSVPIVQLTGAIAMPGDDHSSIDIVRDVARAVDGPAFVFYAPFTVPDASTARCCASRTTSPGRSHGCRASRRPWSGWGSGRPVSRRCTTLRTSPIAQFCMNSVSARSCPACSSRLTVRRSGRPSPTG